MERLTQTTTNLEIGAQKKREQFREDIFPELVAAHILEHITDDLGDAGFEKQEIREIQHAFLELTEKQKKAVLAIPAQLRPKLFELCRAARRGDTNSSRNDSGFTQQE
jgi:hypothetical protein